MKLNFVQNTSSNKNPGVIVGSLFQVDKVKGWSLKFKSKIRNEKNELIDMSGQKLMEIAYGDGFLCLPNRKRVEGSKQPHFLVYAYPDAKPWKGKGK